MRPLLAGHVLCWACAVPLLLAGSLRADEQTATDPVQRSYGNRYAEREGRELLADVYRPAGEGPFPGVLMIHGGAWMSGSRWNMVLHANALARAGYVVVNIEYRLAPTHKYPAQLDDCLDAWRWMSAHTEQLQIDPDKVALYGYSAGAHLACLVGLNPPDDPKFLRPKAIVAGGTPGDFAWIADDSTALAYFLGGTRQNLPDVYRAASPVTHVTADDPPVFLFHGEDDTVVPLPAARRLHARLKDQGVPCQLVKIPGQGHVAPFLDPRSPQRAIRFLDVVLRDRREPAEQPADDAVPASEITDDRP